MANLISGLGGTSGFGTGQLSSNDDGSTGLINLSSIFATGLNFFGTSYTGLYINNNGNVTFGTSLSTFTPFALNGATSAPIIAPFFADVDTRGGATIATGGGADGANTVYYALDTANHRLVVTWDDVGYYGAHADKADAFQLVLTDESGLPGHSAGDFSITFIFQAINWTTGDASSGSAGLGGTVAVEGYSAGTGTSGTYSQLPSSSNQALDLALPVTPGNTGLPGVYTFDVTNGVVVSPVNTPPTIGGAQGGQAANAGGSVNPFSSVTINDPDAGQSETITVSFAAVGGTLSGGGFVQTAPGVYSAMAAAGGAGASAAAAQADLRAAVFIPTAGQSTTTTFTVTVSDGQAVATNSATSVVATPTSTAGGNGGGVSTTTTPLSLQYGLLTEFQNLERALANGVDANSPGTPIYTAFSSYRLVAAQLDGGRTTLAQAEASLAHLVDGTTAVAIAEYGFFTGSTPTAQGLNYLVHSGGNATDLNDAFYANFSTENRYINLSVSLATGLGVGAAAFQAAYGALSLSDATAKAYAAIFGAPADATKVAALLNTLVSDGLGGQETRAQYFAQYGGDGANGTGTKAAVVGFLLSNAVQNGSGVYGAATEHYLAALAHGQAPSFGSELALHYGADVSLVGVTPIADPTVMG